MRDDEIAAVRLELEDYVAEVFGKPAPPRDQVAVVPRNKLSVAERAEILAALNAPESVDVAPLQVHTKLLDQGIYLGSLSSFYRVLGENQQVKKRRRLAQHPPRDVPELVATKPGEVLSSYATSSDVLAPVMRQNRKRCSLQFMSEDPLSIITGHSA